MAKSADHGRQPYVVDIERATIENQNYRTTVWTGRHLQMTLMSIPVGDDIGLEKHPDNDQFLRIEQGTGRVEMGERKKELTFVAEAPADSVVLVPAGWWHNITNVGDVPLQIYALYGPSHHQPGTVHATKADAEADEH